MDGKKRFEGAYREERGRLIAWLTSRVGEEDAQDILHDVAARAFSNLDALEPVRDLAAWLWRSARNAVIDAWRARTRKPAVADLENFDAILDDVLMDAGDDLARRELLDALALAIEDLSPAQREVIVAQALQGETFASLSERTGVSVDTLAARKRYALARLRESLREYA